MDYNEADNPRPLEYILGRLATAKPNATRILALGKNKLPGQAVLRLGRGPAAYIEAICLFAEAIAEDPALSKR